MNKKASVESPLPHLITANPRSARVLLFNQTPGGQTGVAPQKHKFLRMNIHYSPAKIYPASLNLNVKKWYVIYRYMNPDTFRKEPIKVYEDINRYSGQEKISYALLLKDSVNAALRDGYNPFAADLLVREEKQHQLLQEKINSTAERHNYTIVQAVNYFWSQKKEQKKAKATIERYQGHMGFLLEWLSERSLLLKKASEITANQIIEFLKEKAEEEEWGNKTYNNYLGTLQACFNYLAKNIHGIIEKNPIEGAEMRTTISRKHTAYSDEQLKTVLGLVRDQKDVYMEGLILTSYYACVRAKAEMIGLRAGNVDYDRDLIRLDGENTKGRRDDYIPLDPMLKVFYISQGFEKLPADWYLFGNSGKPGQLQASANYYSEHYRKYRDAAALDDRHTLYGFKHTRNIHLAKAGKDPYAIMQLNRHQSLDQVMTYLRDLGILINAGAVENSRKI